MRSQFFSNRLSINSLTITDVNFIFQPLNSEGWINHIGDRKINSLKDASDHIRKIIGSPDVNYWIVSIKQNDTPIGIISLIKRDYLEYPDIGFAFLPSSMSNGYAYEAARALLRNLIDNNEFNAILGITVFEDTISTNVLEKLGFEFQKEIEIQKRKSQVYILSEDKFQISEVTKCFFNCFTNKENSNPQLDALKTICTSDIRIVNINRSGVIYDLGSFLESRKKMLTDGTLVEFEEEEICEETTILANLAHRHSKYEKTGVLNGKRFKQNGHKLFQFKKFDQGWKISTLIWEDNEDK